LGQTKGRIFRTSCAGPAELLGISNQSELDGKQLWKRIAFKADWLTIAPR
jgi:hypothetical protein